MDLDIAAIGFVEGARKTPQDDHWGSERSRITLVSEIGPEALYGLDAFSHAEIIFYFDQVPSDKIERGARYPRGNADWPLLGIFAQTRKKPFKRHRALHLSHCRRGRDHDRG